MDIAVIKILFSFAFSFLITYFLTPHLCSLAKKLEFMDKPDGNIKKQVHAVPYLGGVAVYAGFLCGIVFTVPFEHQIFFLIVGTTLLLLLGLIDDFAALKPYQKFFGQIIVALCFLKAGFYLKTHVFHTFWKMPLSILWIVTVINAFNLIDVMDGLATISALGASLGFIAIACLLAHPIVVIILASFIGALGAFFVYNRPPARIYLGDAGAMFIGGLLATIPFLFDWGTYNEYGYLAPVVILAIPLLECLSLVVIRTKKGIPFYYGSRDHFSQYLSDGGMSKNAILVYVASLSAVLGATSLFFVSGYMSISQILALAVLFLGIWFSVLYRVV